MSDIYERIEDLQIAMKAENHPERKAELKAELEELIWVNIIENDTPDTVINEETGEVVNFKAAVAPENQCTVIPEKADDFSHKFDEIISELNTVRDMPSSQASLFMSESLIKVIDAVIEIKCRLCGIEERVNNMEFNFPKPAA